MDKILKYLFLLISFSIYSQEKDFSKLLNSFPKQDTLILYSSGMEFHNNKLKDSIVEMYICKVKNECKRNVRNNNPYSYYGLSQKKINNFYIFSYIQFDSYEVNNYIFTTDLKGNKISELHVYSDFYPIFNTTINVGIIEIKRKIRLDCEENDEDCYQVFIERYKLDKNLSIIYTDFNNSEPPETEVEVIKINKQ